MVIMKALISCAADLHFVFVYSKPGFFLGCGSFNNESILLIFVKEKVKMGKTALVLIYLPNGRPKCREFLK